MHYLVTGGAGFIGSHLVERLLGAGHHVTIVDDLSTGRFENIAGLVDHDRVRFIKDSVLRSDLVDGLVRESQGVFHLASAVGVRLIMERPVETIESIFQGTAVVMQAAARYHKRVLLTSTSEVYGKSTDVPFREDGDRLEGPTAKHRWAYAAAKALDEFLALAHWKESRLPTVVVRLFNTVGPRQSGRYGMVLPNFVAAALRGDDLIVHGDGRQSRCFCHVGDVIVALDRLMDCPRARGQVVNVGSDQEITILDLARRVVARTGSASRIRTISYEQAYGEGFEDMNRRIPCTEKVRTLIGWRPEIPLDRIIDDIIADLRGHAAE
jgi:UDP-glucose 4-epimerase